MRADKELLSTTRCDVKSFLGWGATCAQIGYCSSDAAAIADRLNEAAADDWRKLSQDIAESLAALNTLAHSEGSEMPHFELLNAASKLGDHLRLFTKKLVTCGEAKKLHLKSSSTAREQNVKAFSKMESGALEELKEEGVLENLEQPLRLFWLKYAQDLSDPKYQSIVAARINNAARSALQSLVIQPLQEFENTGHPAYLDPPNFPLFSMQPLLETITNRLCNTKSNDAHFYFDVAKTYFDKRVQPFVEQLTECRKYGKHKDTYILF
jgi:hypothetical protein